MLFARHARRPAAFAGRTSGVHLVLAGLLCVLAGSADAATFYVDNQNPVASDSNPGTLLAPYRTIQAAVTARAAAGNVVEVRPGVYREQVEVTGSGVWGSPFVVRSSGSGVVIDGADDFATDAVWTQFSSDVWRAASVTWAPGQVTVDGTRYTASTASQPDNINPGTFQYVAGSGLYLNVGGGTPGLHDTKVGRRSYGFTVPGRSWVTIWGFEIKRSDVKGIYVSGANSGIVITRNSVLLAKQAGIHMNGGTEGTISRNTVTLSGDHGIYLSNGVTETSVIDNESSFNARPAVRAANGIQLNGSPNCRVERNRLHDNQDSGLQVNTGSHNTVSIQNRSWNNGDHGYDHLSSTGTLHIGDLAYGNYKDGFSFEGNAPGGQMFNCISVDNGLTTNEYDLWVDAASLVGFVSDYNLFWNSGGQSPIKMEKKAYASFDAYRAATGRDAHSVSAAPLFIDAPGGDFHLGVGSAAIDAATSDLLEWPALDVESRSRFDEPSKANAGSGPVTYSDIGPHEFGGGGPPPPPTPIDLAPVVFAPATATVAENATVTFVVRATDREAITSFTADLSGLPTGHNATFTRSSVDTMGTFRWTPTFAHAGTYTVTFRAANVLEGTASTVITVTNVDRAPVVVSPDNLRGTVGKLITVAVTASDPDGEPITSLTANLSQLPSGHNAVFTPNASNTGGTLTWTPSGTANINVTFTAMNARSGSKTTHIQIKRNAVSDSPTSITGEAPAVLSLSSGFPVPSAGDVTFVLGLPRSARVDWTVFDLQGRTMKRQSMESSAGWTSLRWDGRDAGGRHSAPGLYLVRVSVDGVNFVRRVSIR